MGFEVSFASADAQVRAARIRKDVARAQGQAFLVVAPVAPPRLWHQIADDVADAFARAVGDKPTSKVLLGEAASAAATALAKVRARLIEPNLGLDASVGVLMTDGDTVHVALSAGVRVYRARGGTPERLYAKVPRPDGAAAGPLFAASERAEPGDLFVLGTRDAFTVRSIGNLATSLARSANASATELCDGVIGPCREAGLGAAAVVLRRSNGG